VGQDQILNPEQHSLDQGHVICNVDQCASLLKTATQLGSHRRNSHQSHIKVTSRATNRIITKARVDGKFVCGCGSSFSVPLSFSKHFSKCDQGNPAPPDRNMNQQSREDSDENSDQDGRDDGRDVLRRIDGNEENIRHGQNGRNVAVAQAGEGDVYWIDNDDEETSQLYQHDGLKLGFHMEGEFFVCLKCFQASA
jgi:hypothetical protein